jgi:transposase
MSAIAGITFWTFYFQLVQGAVKSAELITFLSYLMRHIRRPMIVIWDRLPAHRSRLVRDFVAAQNGRIELEYLPAYAPELNPTEYIWGYWKHHELPNVCPQDWWDLDARSRQALRRMRRRPRLVDSFWKQADLCF